MAFDYASVRADGKAVLDELGFVMTFNRYTRTPNAVTGAVTKVLAQTQGLAAVILPVKDKSVEGLDTSFMTDVLGQTNVRLALVSAEGAVFEPVPNDEAVFFGATWQVLGCTPLNVAGTALIYTVGLRKP